MRSIRLLGLCLIAAFAAGAFAAASASAELPEYKVCSPTVNGQFSDSLCTSNVGVGEGKFELQDWTHAKKLALKATDKTGTLDVYIPGKSGPFGGGGQLVGEVTCKSSKGSGAISGLKSSELTLTFKGCAIAGKGCHSPGAGSGAISTTALEGTLGYADAAQTKAAIRFIPKAGAPFAEIECGGEQLVVRGAVIGEYTPVGVISPSSTYTFAVTPEGEQDISGFNGAIEESFLLTELIGSATLPAGLLDTVSLKGESFEVQIKHTPAEEVPKWWVAGKMLSGSEALAENTTVIEPFKQELFGKGGTNPFEVQCGEVKVKKGIITGPRSREEEALVYSNCKVLKASVALPECEVKTTESVALLATLKGTVGATQLSFRAKSGAGELTGWHVLQTPGAGVPTCAQKGLYHADGVMICGYTGVENELSEHPLEFTPGLSKVTVGGVAAAFTGKDAVHLASGKLWSAF